MKLQGNWKRGSLHTHTYWSDGRGFPEQMVGSYKQLGYDFVCFSDHNIFPEDRNFWLPVRSDEGHWPPMVTSEILNDYRKKYPEQVETRNVSFYTMVRLKSFAEVKPRFEEPGKFLVIGGEEFTGMTFFADGRRYDVHMNLLNFEQNMPLPPAGTVEDMVTRYVEAYRNARKGWPHETMLMLNHPQWMYWDIEPHQIIDVPEIRHFEVCNGGLEYEPADNMPTTDRFWDAVNAFRAEKGLPLLLGTGCDDSHFYDEKRIHGGSGCGGAWVMVHCPQEFTADNVMKALNCGDYYATNGVELDSIEFTGNTLRVSVAPRADISYRISFIGTKRGFSHDWKQMDFECPKESVRAQCRRSLRKYSDEIGQILKTTDGTEAEYTMSPDDLYVRAIIDSNCPSHVHAPGPGAAQNEKAWTQPYMRL